MWISISIKLAVLDILSSLSAGVAHTILCKIVAVSIVTHGFFFVFVFCFVLQIPYLVDHVDAHNWKLMKKSYEKYYELSFVRKLMNFLFNLIP